MPEVSSLPKYQAFLLSAYSLLLVTYAWPSVCIAFVWLLNKVQGSCMLRTQRTRNGQVLFALSGRIETTEDIEQLQQLFAIETSGQQLILDLRDVTLVNRDAVQFLLCCEADGIKLENCPLHVRRWINETKNGPGHRRK